MSALEEQTTSMLHNTEARPAKQRSTL